MERYIVIDADGHVEPALGADWLRFAKEPYGSWLVDKGRRIFDQEGDRAATRRGAWDPQARLEDMDSEGIDIAVLFGGNMGLSTQMADNAEYAVAYARAYNDWLADYCSADSDRLKGVAMVPVDYPELAAEELRRAVTELGAVAVVVQPFYKNINLYEQHFFPIYEAAQEVDVPVMIHGPGRLRALLKDRYHTQFERHMVDFPMSVMMGSMDLLTGGVLDAFPKLRVAMLEGQCGWIPWWLDRLDEHFEKLPHQVPRIKHPPSEYIETGRVFFSCDADEKELPHVVDRVGEGVIVYASDYPHWDCIFPGSVTAISERDTLSPARKRKILGENAVRLFGAKSSIAEAMSSRAPA